VRKTINDEEGKKPFPDVVDWIKFSDLSWTTDEKGFFYNVKKFILLLLFRKSNYYLIIHRDILNQKILKIKEQRQMSTRMLRYILKIKFISYDLTLTFFFEKLCYHRLGTPQSEDVLICKDPENPEYEYKAICTLDERFVVILINKDCSVVNKVYLIDLKRTNNQIVGK
jgi:prolyl oligopeptidase